MNKSTFSFIIDFVFYSLIIFAVSYIWLRLYIHNNTLILVISLIITLFISSILCLVLKNKISKNKLTKKEEKIKKQILNSLLVMNNNEINNFLTQVFNNNVKKYKDFLVILNEEKTVIFYNFSFLETDINFILNSLKTSEKLEIFNVNIISNLFNKDCNKFVKNIKNFNIKLINFNDFYFKCLKEQNILPNSKIKYEEKTKYSIKELLSIAFNKTKTKSYVLTGLIFLVSSLFLRYNIYYIIFTTLMFSFAMFSYFNKRFNKKNGE